MNPTRQSVREFTAWLNSQKRAERAKRDTLFGAVSLAAGGTNNKLAFSHLSGSKPNAE